MPRIRVFSSDDIELMPCNLNRAKSLVAKNKAYFNFIGDNKEPTIVLNKTSEQVLVEKDGRENE